jgi:uncharacterized membrane protein
MTPPSEATTTSGAPPAPDPTSPRPTTRRPRRVRPGLAWIALSSIAMAAVLVSTYSSATLDDLAEANMGLASTFADRPLAIQVVFYLHIAFAAIALLVGPVQFVARWRRRFPRLHRALGRCYLVGVGIGALTGLVISTVGSVALLGFFGFGSLAVLWGWTGWKAYRSIRAGRVAEHQAWMIRCFALTYAAVTLRLWIGVLVAVQLPFIGPDTDPVAIFDTAYAPVAFLSWLPNIVIAEWMIARRGLPGLRMSPGTVTAREAAAA